MFGLVTRKRIISEFAKDIAHKQKRADYYYYVNNDQEMSSFMLDGVHHMCDLMRNLCIMDEVYNKAYEYYNFRNSGKKGFIPDMELLKKSK